MKKTLYILSVLLLGLVSCNKTEFEPTESKKTEKAEETGLVAITMKAEIPQLQAVTRAPGDRSVAPDIKEMRVAVFGTSGYPQAYALAEPVDENGASLDHYATSNGHTYYFKVLLPVYEGEAHVHIIANGPQTIPFVDQDEESIMSTMRSEAPVGAFWARIIMPDGILTQLDDNGIMQTDSEGNYIPSEGTAHLFEDLVLVRNFAEVLLDYTPLEGYDNLSSITYTLVNIPKYGSVAPMNAGTYVDDFKDYIYNSKTGRMITADSTTVYPGFMFEDEPMNYTVPGVGDISTAVGSPVFMYERIHPGGDKATCMLVKAKWENDSDFCYYRIDLMDEAVNGYYPIYRNYQYKVNIKKVGNRGAKTPTEAMNRDSGGNVSMSTEAQSLTDISDGVSRLYVEYIEKNFTSGGKKTFWVQYVPDVRTGTVDNSKITVSIKEQGLALKEGTQVTKKSTTSFGQDIYEFELNGQDDRDDLVSVLQVKADNGKTGDDKSTLYRDITLRVMKKMEMSLSLVPKKINTGTGESTILKIALPDSLPKSMFPLEMYIEDINHTLNPTGETGIDGDDPITVPVKTAKSLADGTTNSFYFIRTVNYGEYEDNHTINTQFTTISQASATTIYVANEYFHTQSINLLNDGMYVNPTQATVPFSATSQIVEVEFDSDNQSKTWTVTGGTGVTITNEAGATITGGTGTGTFVMHFGANNTASPVTRTATVRCDGVNHSVTITQSALEFSITPDSQYLLYNQTTATVTIHAEEGKSWTASVSGPSGTTPSLSASSGEGTQTLTVTLPTGTTSQRTFTVTATMTDPARTATAEIIQRRTPQSPYTFQPSSYTFSNYNGGATSGDGYVSVSLTNATRNNNQTYITLGRTTGNTINQGTITVTPITGMKITRITVTYSSNTYAGYDNAGRSVSSGSYTISQSTGTWTPGTTYTGGSVKITNGYTNSYWDVNYPRITNIQVSYALDN